MVFRLHSRLVLWNLLIIVVIVSVLGVFVSYSLRQHIVNGIEEQLTQESALVAAYVLRADPTTPPDELANRLGEMLQTRVTLITQTGQVLGDSEVDAKD